VVPHLIFPLPGCASLGRSEGCGLGENPPPRRAAGTAQRKNKRPRLLSFTNHPSSSTSPAFISMPNSPCASLSRSLTCPGCRVHRIAGQGICGPQTRWPFVSKHFRPWLDRVRPLACDLPGMQRTWVARPNHRAGPGPWPGPGPDSGGPRPVVFNRVYATSGIASLP
jgi:hypothetical protein